MTPTALFAVSAVLTGALSAVAAEAPKPLNVLIWPGPAPAGEAPPQVVEVPITVYLPPADRATGAAVISCPGGGYGGLVAGPEGDNIARWLIQHGIAGIVLHYRLPHGNCRLPLLDAQRAIRVVRSHAAEWGIDPKRIGIMGFSAGGHLASTAGTHFDAGKPDAQDPIERLSCRPDFVCLVYPVISMGAKGHGGTRANLLGANPKPEDVQYFSNELQVTDQTPPTFITHSAADTVVPVENSRLFYEALKAHHVPAEYLEFPEGTHGYNGYAGPQWVGWQTSFLRWLVAQGVVKSSILSGSVATGRKARASSVRQNSNRFGPEAALDENAETAWATDDATRSAWLEVDLGEPKTIGRAVIDEAPPARIREFEIQARVGEEWKVVALGAQAGPGREVAFAPVTAQVWRLVIRDAASGPAVNEFQLFEGRQ